jgi:hypothetical protein
MKNIKLVSKITLATLMSSMLFSSVALANETKPALMNPTLINESLVKELKANSKLFSGKITNINKQIGYTSITVANEQETIVYNVKDNLLVIDQKTKKIEKVASLKKNTPIHIIFDKNAPMTLSLPPITSGAQAIVINSDDSSLNVSYFDNNLVNEENTLKLNIDAKTSIINLDGKKALPAELKNKDLLCLYKYTTRSIPAQTSPDLVVLLEKKAVAIDKNQMVLLKDVVKEYGYKMKWIGKGNTVILSKGAHTVTLTIGSKVYGNNKSVVKLEKAPLLKHCRTYVPKAMVELLQK